MYEGEFSGGKKNGKGVKTWATGDVYEGEWLSNRRHGYGLQITRSG